MVAIISGIFTRLACVISIVLLVVQSSEASVNHVAPFAPVASPYVLPASYAAIAPYASSYSAHSINHALAAPLLTQAAAIPAPVFSAAVPAPVLPAPVPAPLVSSAYPAQFPARYYSGLPLPLPYAYTGPAATAW